MNCSDARPLLDALADGELDDDALRAHVDSCPDCARELEARRAFSARLSGAFEGVEPPAGGRARVSAALAAAGRRSRFLPALAAAAVAAVTLSLAAWAVIRSKPTAQQLALAESLRLREARQSEAARLAEEAARDLEAARGAVGSRSDAPAVALAVAVSNLEEGLVPAAAPSDVARLVADTASPDPRIAGPARKTLKDLGTHRLDDLRRASSAAPAQDRAFVLSVIRGLEDRSAVRISVQSTVGGATVSLVQRGDGTVRLSIPGGALEARSVTELLRRHPDVCRSYGVEGSEGRVVVGGNAASVDLQGRLDLLFRTGSWDEELQWDVYRSWAGGRKDVEARVRDLQEQSRREAARPVPPAAVDADAILQGVRALSGKEIEAAREKVEKEMKKLEDHLRRMHELRGRAKSLRAFAEETKE
jgi:hypothetical protein